MHPKLQKSFDRCENRRQEMLDMARQMDPALLDRSPGEREWSMLQVMYHLTQAAELTLGYLNKKIQDPSAIPASSPLADLKVWVATKVMGSSLKFKATAAIEGLESPPPFKEVKERWDQAHESLAAFAENLDPSLINHQVYRHQAAGRMTMDQTFKFLTAHIKHHLPQMKRIQRALFSAVS